MLLCSYSLDGYYMELMYCLLNLYSMSLLHLHWCSTNWYYTGMRYAHHITVAYFCLTKYHHSSTSKYTNKAHIFPISDMAHSKLGPRSSSPVLRIAVWQHTLMDWDCCGILALLCSAKEQPGNHGVSHMLWCLPLSTYS